MAAAFRSLNLRLDFCHRKRARAQYGPPPLAGRPEMPLGLWGAQKRRLEAAGAGRATRHKCKPQIMTIVNLSINPARSASRPPRPLAGPIQPRARHPESGPIDGRWAQPSSCLPLVCASNSAPLVVGRRGPKKVHGHIKTSLMAARAARLARPTRSGMMTFDQRHPHTKSRPLAPVSVCVCRMNLFV